MATKLANPMTAVRKKLSAAGFNRSFLNERILPEWWDDDAALAPSGYAEGLLYLSRRLGVTLDSLRHAAQVDLEFDPVNAKFKKKAGVSDEELMRAKMIGYRAAVTVAAGCCTEAVPLPRNPAELRERILSKGHPYVTLEALLEFCWNNGVPVLHVGEYPTQTKKMDGLSAIVKGRPVVVLARNASSPSAMAFILAHELGHLALGHLKGGFDLLLDQSWDKNERDDEEEQANEFAAMLLTGMKTPQFTAKEYLDGPELARAATKFGKDHKIAPGVVALNYGWTRKFFPVAYAALKELEPSANAVGTILRTMFGSLEADRIPKEGWEWLLRLTKPSPTTPG